MLLILFKSMLPRLLFSFSMILYFVNMTSRSWFELLKIIRHFRVPKFLKYVCFVFELTIIFFKRDLTLSLCCCVSTIVENKCIEREKVPVEGCYLEQLELNPLEI